MANHLFNCLLVVTRILKYIYIYIIIYSETFQMLKCSMKWFLSQNCTSKQKSYLWLLSKIFHETSCFQDRYHLIMYMYMLLWWFSYVRLCIILPQYLTDIYVLLKLDLHTYTIIWKTMAQKAQKRFAINFCNG